MRGVFLHSIVITAFIQSMMVVVEYLNVLTRGAFSKSGKRTYTGQLLLAVGLGLTPGCLGAFVVVTMFSHGLVSIGAVTATMIATSGDEAFFMFAAIPKVALIITAVLAVVALGVGVGVDVLARRFPFLQPLPVEHDSLEIHESDKCHCFSKRIVLFQLTHMTMIRGLLIFSTMSVIGMLLLGFIGPNSWGWMRWSLLGVLTFALFITITVPDHFLRDHLWEHITKQHVPSVFLWTLGAMLFVYFFDSWVDFGALFSSSPIIMLLIAVLVGFIPQSGPHFVLIALFIQGSIPFSILLANSVVQDGHGMLPMLAYSRKFFLIIKFINLLAGLFVGGLLLSIGF
jgi:Putative, 10TM heavy-metal exporter